VANALGAADDKARAVFPPENAIRWDGEGAGFQTWDGSKRAEGKNEESPVGCAAVAGSEEDSPLLFTFGNGAATVIGLRGGIASVDVERELTIGIVS